MTKRKIMSIPKEIRMMAVDEMWTRIPINKMPKARHVIGLGKPTTPQEPCNDERIEQQNKAKVLHYSEHALRDYNEKHGTDLMLLNLLEYEFHFGYCAHTVDFKVRYREWIHINLEAIRLHSEKPLLLFAELYMNHDSEPVHTRLSLLPPIDNLHGNNLWPCTIRIPFHRFCAGFDDICPVKEEAIQTRSMMAAGGEMAKYETCLAEFALMAAGARCKFCPANILHPGFDCFH